MISLPAALPFGPTPTGSSASPSITSADIGSDTEAPNFLAVLAGLLPTITPPTIAAAVPSGEVAPGEAVTASACMTTAIGIDEAPANLTTMPNALIAPLFPNLAGSTDASTSIPTPEQPNSATPIIPLPEAQVNVSEPPPTDAPLIAPPDSPETTIVRQPTIAVEAAPEPAESSPPAEVAELPATDEPVETKIPIPHIVTPTKEAPPISFNETADSDTDDADPFRSQPDMSRPANDGPIARREEVRPALVADQVHETFRTHLDQLKQQGRVEVHMDLHPPELGRMQLHLTMEDNQVNVRMVVQSDNAKQLLDQQAEPLRVRFGEMGVNLGQLDVRRDGSGGQQPAPEFERAALAANAGPSVLHRPRNPYAAGPSGRTLVDVIA